MHKPTTVGPIRFVAALLVLAGCTRPLRVSDEPAPIGETPTKGILALLIGEAPEMDVVLLDTTVITPSIDPRDFVKGYWADSARVGFEAALGDLIARSTDRQVIDSSLVAGLPLRLVTRRPALELFRGPAKGGVWFMEVSRIGFNRDSTFAAIYHEYHCGPLCAGATVSLFARRAGHRWTHWDSNMLWIS